jgi:YNFM family putative membrane transporter
VAAGDGEWPGHRAGEPGLRRAATAVFLAGLAVFATLYAPQALLPELTRSFGVSPASATLAISISTAALAVGLLVLGPVSDRRGRTPVLHASLAAAAVVAVLLALTPSWWLLLVLRAAQGFALAGLPAVAVAYLREELHPEVSSRAIGLYVSGTAIGGLTGRLLSGFLAELGGWRAALGGAAALAVACAGSGR